MSRFSTQFQRIGGPGAVTWWAFWISLADRLVTVSVQPLNTTVPFQTRVFITVVAQLAMFAPLVLLRFTVLNDVLRPRPWVALAGFAFADILRGLVIDQLFHQLAGLPLRPDLRVASGFLPTLVPLIVVAYVVNTLNERRRDLTALLEVRGQLERSRAEAESSVLLQNDELVQRVRTVMQAQLTELSSERPAEVIAQLQRTANDVVRPLSHELANSLTEREDPAQVMAPISVGWRQVLGDSAITRPLQPIATTVTLSAVWISAAIAIPFTRVAILISLPLILVLLSIGNVILRRVLPSVGSIGQFAFILGACLSAGLVIALFVRVTLRGNDGAVAVATSCVFFVTVIGTAMSLIGGALAARTAMLEETANSIEDLRHQVVRTRQLRWFHQRGLSRALHGPVQTAVTAAALRLQGSLQEAPISPAVVDSVRGELLQVLDVLHTPDDDVMSIDESVARIVGTWDGLCQVNVSIVDAGHDVLSNDIVIRALAADILTEAVSNAVRHGKASNVDVDVTLHDGLVHVFVRDNGASTPLSMESGLGSQLLDECTLDWSFDTTSTGHALRVVAPLAARARTGVPMVAGSSL